ADKGDRALGLSKENQEAFTTEPAQSKHWDRWFSRGKLANKGFKFDRTMETDGVSMQSGDQESGQLVSDQLRRWKLTKGQNNARRDTERWLAFIKPHLQHLAAASSAGTSLEANLKHITVTLATWDAVWEVYLDAKWARQRLRLYGGQDRALEQFFKKVEHRLLHPAWSQQRDQPVWGLLWCPVVAPRKPPQAPCSSQAATQPAASEPGPSTPPPAKRNKRTKTEQAAEPTQPTKGKGKAHDKAARAGPAPQPGRWLDRDCRGEQVAATGAVLLARPASFASQG
ncbi:hypothetical protein QJQ45_008544, partial [Haematococcus lacustris]